MHLFGYQKIYDFMVDCAHGDIYEIAHAQRVLCNSLRILDGERNADAHIVILAALLHDIGRGGPLGDHAAAGSGKARAFLLDNGYSGAVAAQVADCILRHRYKSTEPPCSNEAKILFDADKLDLMGAVGTAHAIKHAVQEREPFYTLGTNGLPDPGKKGEQASLIREYRKKLKKLPGMLHTATARNMAAEIRQAQDVFFSSLLRELENSYAEGIKLLVVYAELARPQER